MKITLIAPPWIFKEEVEFVSQNLGLGYLASYLKERGHEVVIIDALIEGVGISSPLSTKYANVLQWGLSHEEIVERIPLDSKLIGITAPFTDSKFVVNPLSHLIKKTFPDTTLMIGGIYPSTLPEEAINSSAADVLILGEGEIPISQIAGGKRWEEIKGLVFKSGGAAVKTGKGEVVKNIENDIPMPSYNVRPMEKYTSWSPRGNRQDKTLSMFSSRGCPFQCEFCSIHHVYGRMWRAFSAERIVREIQIAVDKFGVDHVEFEDDNLTLQKDRAVEIFDGIKKIRGKNGKQIAWSAPNGVMIDSLDRDLVFKMKESGAELLYLPVESGDTKILKAMNKCKWETHLDKTLEVLKYCVEAGIETSAFFIVGYPGEDRESFKKTLEFCEKLVDTGISAITPLIATPYPNTELYRLCKENNWLVHKDMENVLIYQRYSDFLPEFVLIDTPLCSRQEAYDRHQTMMHMFSSKHNVYKGV